MQSQLCKSPAINQNGQRVASLSINYLETGSLGMQINGESNGLVYYYYDYDYYCYYYYKSNKNHVECSRDFKKC